MTRYSPQDVDDHIRSIHERRLEAPLDAEPERCGKCASVEVCAAIYGLLVDEHNYDHQVASDAMEAAVEAVQDILGGSLCKEHA